jgi:diacylglycerol kinase family enzyme
MPFIILSVTVVVAAAAVTGAAWTQYSQARWIRRLEHFHQKHHGYCSPSSDDRKKKDVLLIVNPASGGGKAMKMYSTVVEALEAKGLTIEVYVTHGGDDMIDLTKNKDFSQYKKMICVMAGDSSLFELTQDALLKNGGKWPWAPVLILPAGSGNALSSEFHQREKDVSVIIQKANTVKKGCIIKLSSPESPKPRYAMHNGFDGLQRLIIDVMERRRNDIYIAFGELAIMPVFMATVLFRRDKSDPVQLVVLNSDVEGLGHNLGFGISRFDDKLVLVQKTDYKGPWNDFSDFMKLFKGQLAKEFEEGNLADDMKIEIGNKFTVEGASHYHFYCDGSASLSIEGTSMTIEAVPEAMPYFVFDED